MTLTQTSQRPSEQGFTLVELAIVMVIIGILIGGILKGQELIANAKISGTVGQLKGLDAGMNTFQDKYNALPGDMIDATTRLPGCTAANNCADGSGNQIIGQNLNFPGAPGPNAGEGALIFMHLSSADLISGIDVTGNSVTFGKILPTAKAGGGMWVGVSAGNENGTTNQSGKQYAVLNGTTANVGAATGAFSASTAAQIDRKLDDGRPQTGAVQTTGNGCVNAAAYDEDNTASTCAMYSRVLN